MHMEDVIHYFSTYAFNRAIMVNHQSKDGVYINGMQNYTFFDIVLSQFCT